MAEEVIFLTERLTLCKISNDDPLCEHSANFYQWRYVYVLHKLSVAQRTYIKQQRGVKNIPFIKRSFLPI